MSTSTTTLEDGINFDTNRYERVALVDIQPGDVVRIPTLIINGEVASWSTRAYTVESVEEKAPGVFFVWRPADEFPPNATCDRFMMMCGPSAQAGVLRVKRVVLVDDNDKIWATTKSNPELSHAFDSEHRAMCRTTIRPSSPFRTTLAMARDMVKLHEQCARKLLEIEAAKTVEQPAEVDYVSGDSFEVGDVVAYPERPQAKVIRPAEAGEDYFGRPIKRLRCRMVDGDREGFVDYGPDGVLPRLRRP